MMHVTIFLILLGLLAMPAAMGVTSGPPEAEPGFDQCNLDCSLLAKEEGFVGSREKVIAAYSYKRSVGQP